MGDVLLLLVGTSIALPCSAHGAQRSKFFETIGVSVAVGAVLGASTLPFYEQPSDHWINVAYGASAGALLGVGILVVEWIGGGEEELGDGSLRRSQEILARAGHFHPVKISKSVPMVSLNW